MRTETYWKIWSWGIGLIALIAISLLAYFVLWPWYLGVVEFYNNLLGVW